MTFDKSTSQQVNSWSARSVITAYASTLPECIVEQHKIICESPEGDHSIKPCADHGCSSSTDEGRPISECKEIRVYTEWVAVDSRFKTYQIEKEREDKRKENEEKNIMTVHHSTPPFMIYRSPIPNVLQIFNRIP